MKCLILAAGYATRLYPLTENFPKPLLKVRGKSILDYLIDDLDSSSLVDGYILVTNHRFVDIFREWAAGRQDIKIIDDGTETNDTRLGAVMDLKLAAGFLDSGEDALVVAGDNLLDFSLLSLLEYAQGHNAPCVLRYEEQSESRLRKSGVLQVDADDMIIAMEEKPADPKSHWCCPPFYYYTSASLAMLPLAISEGCGTDAPGSFLAWLSGKMPVYAMKMPGRRYDIGTLESYEAVKSNGI